MARNKRRTWAPRELRMTEEFMARQFPDAICRTRVRLGSPAALIPEGALEEEEIRMLKVRLRWADGVAILPDRLILVETKIRPRLGPTEALELYEWLLPSTPEFEPYRALPVEKWFVYAIEDPVVNLIARRKGIRCIEYKPAWLPEYLRILQPRERRSPTTKL